MYTCGVHLCCVHASTGNTGSALLLDGRGATEQQQLPHLPQAAGTGMINFPLRV